MEGFDMNLDNEKGGWNLEHSYARLPELFFAKVRPTRVMTPKVVVFNRELAGEMGLDADFLGLPSQAGVFTGNVLPDGAEPIAQAYAGHQFGHFTGLGDGRAILLGEQVRADGRHFDVQLKGAGRTPFSRGGDGRAALGPMLREYVISEAMFGLGIPTTRGLAVATTGEVVRRAEDLPGAVLMRVAASHVRVGTFQWAAAHQDEGALRALADHAIGRHFPDVAGSGEERFKYFFKEVMDRQASLVAGWMGVGFIHGVLNTDNVAVSGETIDYGPCAFMDGYDPETVFSSIDRNGRYAYGRQPEITRWNLARLAEVMLPILDADQGRAVDFANEVLGGFEGLFRKHWLGRMRGKLGLFSEEEGDGELVDGLLEWMRGESMDFTNSFRALSEERALVEAVFPDAGFMGWHGLWMDRLGRQEQGRREVVEQMRGANPAVIPRNHKVEEALAAASDEGDFGVMMKLLEVLADPFGDDPAEDFTLPGPVGGEGYQTFCGT